MTTTSSEIPERVETVWPSANGLSTEQIAALMKPLSKARVAERQGMSYLQAYDVRATLIRMFGFGGFDLVANEAQVVFHQPPSEGQRNHVISVMVKVTLHIKAANATYSEYAVGTSQQPQPGEAFDMAVKTAESDAMKRCATNLGTQFGLSLYDNGNTSEIVRVLIPGVPDWDIDGGDTDEPKVD